jgi:hypothetical protein
VLHHPGGVECRRRNLGKGTDRACLENLGAKTDTNNIGRTTQIERNKVRPKAEEREINRVEVQLTESYNPLLSCQLTMRHRRCFSNASSKQILSLLLGMKFCGADGLMVDSTCECEEYSPDSELDLSRTSDHLETAKAQYWPALLTSIRSSSNIRRECAMSSPSF